MWQHIHSLANQQKVAIAQKTEDKQLYPDTTYGDTWDTDRERTNQNQLIRPCAYQRGQYYHFQHANIAHMGDLVFNRRYAFVDRSAGASVEKLDRRPGSALANLTTTSLFWSRIRSGKSDR